MKILSTILFVLVLCLGAIGVYSYMSIGTLTSAKFEETKLSEPAKKPSTIITAKAPAEETEKEESITITDAKGNEVVASTEGKEVLTNLKKAFKACNDPNNQDPGSECFKVSFNENFAHNLK